MLGGNTMNDKSKDLLKKMCSVLKVVRQVCLISFALSIGLSLFYAFNKDVYNTLFGSIRIDYLQLIFKDDAALHKDKMSMWLPLILLITAIFIFIIYKSIQTIESICTITMDHTPFDVRVANHIKNLPRIFLQVVLSLIFLKYVVFYILNRYSTSIYFSTLNMLHK